jgi:C-terminal processing protease CtpA/Prc
MENTRAVTERMAMWLRRLCPDPERTDRLCAALETVAGDHHGPVDAGICRAIERACRPISRHVELEFVPDGSLRPDETAPGWPPQDAAEVRERAGSVARVERLPGAIGVLALTGLDSWQHAAPFAEAAFAHLQGVRALVLDLRANGGGDPATATRTLEWLAGPRRVHVADVIYKDHVRQWWTDGRAAGDSLPAGAPVAVLVSAATYSSGEALAYHARSVCGALVVGETTPGAADHVTPIALTPHVGAVLPEARVRDVATGANWEQAGVVPDLACAADDALDVACAALRR